MSDTIEQWEKLAAEVKALGLLLIDPLLAATEKVLEKLAEWLRARER